MTVTIRTRQKATVVLATIIGLSMVSPPAFASDNPQLSADGGGEAVGTASATAPEVERRFFLGRAELWFWTNIAIPEFTCPIETPFIDATYLQNPKMPLGLEGGSGDIRGYIAPHTLKWSNGRVAGWTGYWASTVTNWNVATQNVFLYAHCTNDRGRAGTGL